MKISIITSVYNNEKTIEDTIKSVISQTYDNIEYIIVDGGSTDNTLNIIENYKNKISKFISEKDRGIYDGLNKGIKMATGDIIAFIHSDDIYANSNVIKEAMNLLKKSQTDSVYADLVYVERENTNNTVRYWKSGDYFIENLKKGWMPPHPTFFVKKEFYDKYGKFDLDFDIAADYDFMLRMLGKHKISTTYLPKVLYKMRVGGVSNKNLSTIFQKSKEDIKALKKNNIGGINTLIMKNISKIPQFLKRKNENF